VIARAGAPDAKEEKTNLSETLFYSAEIFDDAARVAEIDTKIKVSANPNTKPLGGQLSRLNRGALISTY
jgi:hypothetical protein